MRRDQQNFTNKRDHLPENRKLTEHYHGKFFYVLYQRTLGAKNPSSGWDKSCKQNLDVDLVKLHKMEFEYWYFYFFSTHEDKQKDIVHLALNSVWYVLNGYKANIKLLLN